MKQQKIDFFPLFKNVFELLDSDDRIKPKHITMYLAIFRRWNQLKFRQRFIINRSDFMIKFKFKSKESYAQALKELHQFGYIKYSLSSSKRSMVEPTNFTSLSCEFEPGSSKNAHGSSKYSETSSKNVTDSVRKNEHIEDKDLLIKRKGEEISLIDASVSYADLFSTKKFSC